MLSKSKTRIQGGAWLLRHWCYAGILLALAGCGSPPPPPPPTTGPTTRPATTQSTQPATFYLNGKVRRDPESPGYFVTWKADDLLQVPSGQGATLLIDTIGWRPKGWILIYPLKGGAKAERVEHWDKMETEKFIERPLEVVDVDAKVVDWIKAGGLKMFVNNQRGEGHPTINTVDLVDRETGRKLREPQ